MILGLATALAAAPAAVPESLPHNAITAAVHFAGGALTVTSAPAPTPR
jgi:hypothetical protein